MARLSVIARNNKRKKMVDKYAEQRAELKRTGQYDELDKLPRNASPVRLRNRCNITGKPRGYMRKFGLCRNQFRELAAKGHIPGITKASW